MRALSHPTEAWPAPSAPQAAPRSDDREPWGWAELFIAGQFLWGVALFLPGMQAYRPYLRALPYLSSMAALVYYFRRPTGEPLHASARWLIASLGLLVLNLLHSSTHSTAGIAQVVFQLSIAAPALWMTRAVRSEAKLARVLWIVFLASAASASVGILQVYYPDTFLPPEFSALAQEMNPDLVSSLTYRGADDRQIIRPPGLSDMPGGSAVAGMLTMVLGIVLAFRARVPVAVRAACLTASAVGMTTLLLTQVRSLALIATASVGVFALLRLRQGRAMAGAASVVLGGGLVLGAYVWAVAVGGDSLADRFSGLLSEGVVQTFQQERGAFLTVTLSDLLFEYPLGAGLGRWGMMHVYFGDASMWEAPPIHVEIQPTGWLLDGGIPMWIVMAGALVAGLRATYLVAVSATGSIQESATAILCLQLTLLVICLTGPAFNTQMGIQYWALTAALWGPVWGAAEQLAASEERAAYA
jgi:hypothetical protein